MAVYYKWIKGCQTGAKLSGQDAGLWTYWLWGKSNSTGTPTSEDSLDTLGTHVMPQLAVRIGKNDSNTDSKTQNLGYLLTNNMPTPTIINDWNFNSCLNFISSDGDAENGPLAKVHGQQGWLNLSSYKKENSSFFAQPIKMWGHNNVVGGTSTLGVYIGNDGLFDESKWRIKITHNDDVAVTENEGLQDGVLIRGKTIITTNQTTDLYNNFYVQGGVFLGAEINTSGDPTGNATATFGCYGKNDSTINFYRKLIVHNEPVEAEYFNATSDKRAKENIQLAEYNALALIKKLPIYTYNYVNKKETVTGILAQDLLQYQPENLKLVSNINATGENGDYMSIKNDKLMFVLMKAIQEQQEQIERLKKELDKLKER